MLKFCDKEYFTNPGDALRVQYAPHVEPDGTIELIESGVENWQEYIDSFKESSEISAVVARFVNSGDPTVLEVKQGMYGDFTSMPKTYAEALQLKIDADRMYASLPVDVKEKFSNDANKFFALSGTEEWYNNLGSLVKNPFVKTDEEVKMNES